MNNYQQIIDYLFALQRFGIKLTLENITALLQQLDNPQNKWPSIHIAGTNGKGSTAAILESILMQAGYKVGLYTSPHLIDFRERIRINRNHIPQEDVINFTIRMKDLIERITPSFFEAATAMAFWYFAKEEIDIGIIEVGLGGRLDSTNVVTPMISIVTNVDIDHQKYLGNTIQEIAAEKAGIIKSGIPCITNNRNERVVEILSKECLSKNSELIKVNGLSEYRIISKDFESTNFNLKIGANIYNELHLNLPGDHQIENAILAIGTLKCLKGKWKISQKDISTGLRDVIWRGRINLISREPFIIIDVSHNTSGFEKTLSFLNNFFPKERLKVITALQEDKDFEKIGDLLSYYSENVYLVDLKLGKPLPASKLADVLNQKKVNSKIINSIGEIEPEIHQLEQKDTLWLIIGSHYLAGEAYQNFKSLDFYN